MHAMDALAPSEAPSFTDGLRRRRPTLSKYGSTYNPPQDDALFYVSDDTYGFLARGRDFEPSFVTHKYTSKEKEALNAFESLDYLPPHSVAFKQWTRQQKTSRFDMDRWMMMSLIGFSVGFIGFLLHQLIEKIARTKWQLTMPYLESHDFVKAWLVNMAYTLLFVFVAAGSVVFLRPSAAGSGIPEVIGFLNGTMIRHIFNVKTMIVKFLSCVCALGCGMPVGPEGPMIHLGSLVGAGLSQFKSDTLKFKLPYFERFRNPEDRRNFISAGAAAGIASAFGAPVGGLLFSMEEVSSFWNTKLSWQTFFCCMISTFTTDLFNSAFDGFQYTGNFGQFKKERYIIFNISEGIDVNILMFIPTVFIGMIGGSLGAIFTITNLKITRARKRIISKIRNESMQKFIRIIEPHIVMVVVVTVSLFLPMAFSCSSFTCKLENSQNITVNCFNSTKNNLHVEPSVRQYICPDGTDWKSSEQSWMTNRTYNELATLMFGTSETAVRHLFSRNTHLQFNYPALFTMLPFYFIMVCWACGTSVSCGILVPMLFIGALYGRIVGRVLVTLFGVHSEQFGYWAWMDPGAFALIGAASFFGGVSRLTMAVTVIMMELTNDVQFLLPIMVAVMVSKWVGDFFTHPLYHSLLELKCIPFLDQDPSNITIKDHDVTLSLELFTAFDVMSTPVVTVKEVETASRLSELLLITQHGGYPVTKTMENGQEVFYGLITRLEITVLLLNENLFLPFIPDGISEIAVIDYHKLTIDKLHDPELATDMLLTYTEEAKYRELYVDLRPYVNQSAMTVNKRFSLHRTYIIFRSLGLRHLTIVDEGNNVIGILTRKDLMGFSIEEKISSILHKNVELESTASINLEVL